MPIQNKAFNCYLLLIIWILLLVAGIYKYLEKENISEPIATKLPVDTKTLKIFGTCNLPQNISVGSEGTLDRSEWILKGLIILIRHGDRGPLQHVKNISSIDCSGPKLEILNLYKAYLYNLTLSGKSPWTGPGSFHNFPLLPSDPTQCQLGQLTMQGITQLLILGDILMKRYVEVWDKLRKLEAQEVLVYSTRYRRTFQSALAFLYGLIPHETLSKVSLLESQSMSFCFKECGCPATDKLMKSVQKSITRQLKSHPAVLSLAESTGQLLFSSHTQVNSLGSDPPSIRDALLTYVCHNSSLPCESYTQCIRKQHVVGVFAYIDWVNHQKWRSIYWRKLSLLRSYGFIKHIVQQMLHMISGSGPFLVLYSGHDHSIEQLTNTLGIHSDPLLLRYASRVIFEVYQENSKRKYPNKAYFRLLSNGKDVTSQIIFCKNVLTIGFKSGLCGIENIIRFLHDDYFSTLNVTNFKDAC